MAITFQSSWEDEDLRALRDSAARFIEQEMQPAAPFCSVQAAVAWPTATRTISACVPPLEKNCRTAYETGLSRSSPP